MALTKKNKKKNKIKVVTCKLNFNIKLKKLYYLHLNKCARAIVEVLFILNILVFVFP